MNSIVINRQFKMNCSYHQRHSKVPYDCQDNNTKRCVGSLVEMKKKENSDIPPTYVSNIFSNILYKCRYKGLDSECKTKGFTRKYIIPLTFNEESNIKLENAELAQRLNQNDSQSDVEYNDQNDAERDAESNSLNNEEDDAQNNLQEENTEELNESYSLITEEEPKIKLNEIITDFKTCKLQPTSIGKFCSIFYVIGVSLNFSSFCYDDIDKYYPVFLYYPPYYESDNDEKIDSKPFFPDLNGNQACNEEIKNIDLEEIDKTQ